MHFGAIPTAVRNHNRADIVCHRALIRRQVDGPQNRFGYLCITLIGAIGRAAITHVMLGCRQHRIDAHAATLQALDRSHAQRRNQRRIFAESFVRAAPTIILRHADARRKSPVHTGAEHFLTGDILRLLHQSRVTGCAHANVVRENHRP